MTSQVRNALLAIALCLIALSSSYATHNRAGEIRYEQIDDLTVIATIITYTKESSRDVDRDSLFVMWGDGSQSTVMRSNGGGEGVILGNDVKKNEYTATHTYPGFGVFTISMQDPNRNGGILNVTAPNSITVPFYIETTVRLLGSQFSGFNRSVVLLQEPIDFGCIGEIFEHDPGAFDPDGDSLAYELITPLQDVGTEVLRYELPSEVIENGGVIQFDERTGQFLWITPQLSGEYNIAFRVNEYRDGILIASTIRDMQIFIDDCINRPPQITAQSEFCVVAGEELRFLVTATDPDTGQMVLLEGNGGPFVVDNPATLIVDTGFQDPVVTAEFIWQTDCNHIREQPYEIIFKATDNFLETTGLADLQKIRIKVVGPPPLDPQAENDDDAILVSWEAPYACEDARDEYFRGFSMWRRENSLLIEQDTCREGLEGRGYVRIANRLTEQRDGRYIYRDTDVMAGVNYCYRITAEFSLLTAAGNPFNSVESLPSDEACQIFNQDRAVLTRVSVLETDEADGMIEVRWRLPDPEAVDTTLHTGRHRLELLRAEGVVTDPSVMTAVPGAVWESRTFAGLAADTLYMDENLNTVSSPYSYAVRYSAGDPESFSSFSVAASSPYLVIGETDRALILDLFIDVPWSNVVYTILQQDPITGLYSERERTTELPYRAIPLLNGEESCFQIVTEGSYGIAGFPDPLINFSQRDCGVPIDTVPPCIPDLEVRNICTGNSPDPDDFFTNFLSWAFADQESCVLEDLERFRIYYSETTEEPLELLREIQSPDTRTYEHELMDNIAGCYAISAVDEAGNESRLSPVLCVDNCPEYTLPNTFTPNQDGSNDLFIPFPYRFIEAVDIKIFNRWGQLVFETADPDIRWDGNNMSGETLAEGVYYYQGTVLERRVAGITPAPAELSGFIHLIR